MRRGRCSQRAACKHLGLLRSTYTYVAKEPDACLLLVGDGPGRADVEQQVNAMGLGNKVHFLGTRRDVPDLMLGAMDLFLFPSLHEGLGLVLIEAQAAGLPCIVAKNVPDEVDVIPTAVKRLSLDRPATEWADAVLAAHRSKDRLNAEEALRLISESPFNIEVSASGLTEYYQRLLGDGPST